MSFDFQNLLITHQQDDFQSRLVALRQAIVEAARFEFGSDQAATVSRIIRDVSRRGDAAVAEYTEKFDNIRLDPSNFLVSAQELKRAHDAIDRDLLESLRGAIANVRRYQSEIFIGDKNTHPGVRYTPVRSAGVCVPGASAPLPSTVIMTAVPAQVAGVQDIAVISPPRFNGGIHPVILAVCAEIGVERVYRIGGVQAVAALACGTETVGKVDKIVGPGNQWVQMAKREVFGLVDIDSVAGPSEVLIVANAQASPAWVAADMLSQAEHAPGSAIVFTDDLDLARRILAELETQTAQLGRAADTAECLRKFSGIAVFDDFDKVIDWTNDFASEHLQIQCGDQSRAIAERITNAGALFIGPNTPVAVGDYWAGPSHTLPTGASAKFFSPLSSNDFLKSTSIIEYSPDQLAAAADHITRLALTEGLDAHARSVTIRRTP